VDQLDGASIQGARRIMSLILVGWATTMGGYGIGYSIFTKQFNRARPSFAGSLIILAVGF
jgi:hypothetical protein